MLEKRLLPLLNSMPQLIQPSKTLEIISEQEDYEQHVFRVLLRSVSGVCAILFVMYLFPYLKTGSWFALTIALTFLAVSAFSTYVLLFTQPARYSTYVGKWLALATWTVFSFGLLQSHEFIHIMALGACIVIVLAAFLEPVRNAYFWAIANVAGYVLTLVVHSVVTMPTIDMGMFYSWVMYGTPVAVLIIVAELGRVTTQHFKSSLVQSQLRARQIHSQKRRLARLANEAEQGRLKAEKADRIKSAFLASMSHELRTPLNAVINFTQFVMDGDAGEVTEQQAELLGAVVSSGRHLLGLINDVLDISKIEAGSLELFIEDDVDLNALVDRVVTIGKSLVLNKPIEIHVHTDADLPHIRCDRQRIFQILINIMSNACKFTDQGEINIRMTHKRDMVEISIADTGPGIAPEDHENVFVAFKQTERGMVRGGGTGLGMAIAKSLTEAHYGKIWLESSLGAGATFLVSLPVESSQLTPVNL